MSAGGTRTVWFYRDFGDWSSCFTNMESRAGAGGGEKGSHRAVLVR